MNFIDKMVERFIKLNRRMKRWQRVVSVMAAVVVFATTYALILPAITLDTDTATTQAGIEVAASENEPDEAGTVFESEEEEEPAAEENVQEEVPEEAVAEENSGSESGSQGAEETQSEVVDDNDTDEGEQTEVLSVEEAATYSTTEAAIAAVTGKTAEEIKLITEDTKLVFNDPDDEYVVTAEFGESAKLPDGVQLRIKEITKESDPEAYEAYYQKALSEMQGKYDENTTLSFAKFYDIAFVYEGVEIEPSGNVNVRIEYKQAVEIEKTTTVDTIHFDKNDEEKAEVIDSDTEGTEKEVEAVQFESDRFSVYGIVGTETISTQFITADGKTLSVTATFDARELLPKDAVLEVSEVTYEDDPDAYAKRNERLAEALFEKYGNVAITDARYLDISVMVPDESVGGDAKKEYEPVYPVKVKVDYTETMDTTNPGEYKDYNDGSTKVTPDIGNHIVGVHYTEDGAEFLETVDESTNTGVSETVTKTDSFSEYDFAYIYEYEIVDTDYDYEPSQISTMTINTGMTTKAAGSGMLRATGDTPAHTKTLSNNHDGTHKLSLTVTGDADTDSNTASNANVIIVFDTSNSMINYYVPMANGARGSNNADGSDSFVLYRNTNGTEADDGYSGTVYTRTWNQRRNRWEYSEYTGQRYSKTIRRADAAEKVLYDFAHALYGYQNTDDPSTPEDESKNIQTALITFNKTATTTESVLNSLLFFLSFPKRLPILPVRTGKTHFAQHRPWLIALTMTRPLLSLSQTVSLLSGMITQAVMTLLEKATYSQGMKRAQFSWRVLQQEQIRMAHSSAFMHMVQKLTIWMS